MKQFYSDKELQDFFRDGQEWAFEMLYKRHVIKLVAIAMQKTNDRALSEELVQDAFMVYYKLPAEKKELTSVFAFLYVILKNKIMDHFRHILVRKKYESHLEQTFDELDHSTVSFIETRELEKLIDKEISLLPPKCQSVFTLSRKNLLSNKEIASTLSISENTVEQHMRKALRILRLSIMKSVKIILML
ncbi:RNA polymerase sigma-70 factor [Pedobacter rhizosphaerae]|uniref:RNA polymerase sigma-70 factor, ECF subfamily n=1 Tax=Pedobacter rhizosphaerae TaxID=390241 RepID=A0A1H9PQU1_9SPHI|nr:RNA polymerase sigma-70 factor [Pedobacter rhizosphaerae]SER50450.1 RNA polymerase sigma-70 factor, ECF subfamily [Pedobacter rhizosphaerae]